jgi:hypothetical protein
MKTKTFEVTLRHTSYRTFYIEADNLGAATEQAWRELVENDADTIDGDWELETAEEVYE